MLAKCGSVCLALFAILVFINCIINWIPIFLLKAFVGTFSFNLKGYVTSFEVQIDIGSVVLCLWVYSWTCRFLLHDESLVFRVWIESTWVALAPNGATSSRMRRHAWHLIWSGNISCLSTSKWRFLFRTTIFLLLASIQLIHILLWGFHRSLTRILTLCCLFERRHMLCSLLFYLVNYTLFRFTRRQALQVQI